MEEFDFSKELKDYVDDVVDIIYEKRHNLTKEELEKLCCYISRAGYKVGLNTPDSRIPEWVYQVCPHLKQNKNL